MNGGHEFGRKETFVLTFISSIEIDPKLVRNFAYAAADGHVSRVVSLLNAGMPIDIVDEDGTTALVRATMNNQTDVMHEMLQRGASVNKRNQHGSTVLHLAALNSSTDAIQVLLEYGASTTIKDDLGRTPIDVAREENHEEAVLLLQH